MSKAKTDQELRQTISDCRKLLRERKRKAHGEPKRRKGMGVRIGDRDEAEKLKRGYVEAGSFVRRDGSEKLVGLDWRKRVGELAERSGGFCEEFFAPVLDSRDWTLIPRRRCEYLAVDPHHKVRRSVRRDDRLSNLQHLCRFHHDLLDPRKVRSGKVGA